MSYNSSAFMSRMAVVMWKWELWRHGLSEEGGKASGYNAILFADLDVDVLPSGASFQTTNTAAASQLANEWSTELPKLVAASKKADGPSIVGYGEVTTPLNAGLFWVLPPSDDGKLYRDGLQVLKSKQWNATHGFMLAGTPLELFRDKPMRHADGTLLTDRKGRHEVIRSKGWDEIDGGDLEQGFFLYMLYLRHTRGAFTHRSGTHYVRHYVRFKNGKPWVRVLGWRDPNKETNVAAASVECSWENLKRIAFLRNALPASTSTAATTPCGRAFATVRSGLEGRLDAARCCEQLGFDAPIGQYGGDVVHVF